jgi:hypothetical protein
LGQDEIYARYVRKEGIPTEGHDSVTTIDKSRTYECALRDSNPQPPDPKSGALSS